MRHPLLESVLSTALVCALARPSCGPGAGNARTFVPDQDAQSGAELHHGDRSGDARAPARRIG